MTHVRPKPSATTKASHRRHWLFAGVVWACAGTAAAGDFSVGASAGPDRGRVDCVASFACNHSSVDWKLSAGYRLSESVDLQASWFDAGRYRGGDTTPLGTAFGGTFKVEGLGLTGGYRWTFAPSWSLTGRAGGAMVRTRFDYADAAVASVGKTTVQPMLGLSLAYEITPALRLGLDYDVTRFKVYRTRGPLQMLGIAAQYSF